MLKRGREAAANHVAQHVEDHHVGIVEHVMLLEQLHRLAHDIAAAAGPRRRAAGLDAFHAVPAVEHEVLGAQLLGVKVDILQDVDHRGHEAAGQGEGRVVFRVATDLQHPPAKRGKGRRQVRRGGRLADAALAVDGKDLGALDLHRGILVDLDRAVSVKPPQVRDFVTRAHGRASSAWMTPQGPIFFCSQISRGVRGAGPPLCRS